jgi:hypothetical protein
MNRRTPVRRPQATGLSSRGDRSDFLCPWPGGHQASIPTVSPGADAPLGAFRRGPPTHPGPCFDVAGAEPSAVILTCMPLSRLTVCGEKVSAVRVLVVLVEGLSDQRALEALAERRGRDLDAEGILCDAAEEGDFKRGLSGPASAPTSLAPIWNDSVSTCASQICSRTLRPLCHGDGICAASSSTRSRNRRATTATPTSSESSSTA